MKDTANKILQLIGEIGQKNLSTNARNRYKQYLDYEANIQGAEEGLAQEEDEKAKKVLAKSIREAKEEMEDFKTDFITFLEIELGDNLSKNPKPQDPKPQDPKPQDPKPQDPKPQDPKPQDPKPQDPKPQDPKPQDPKPQDPKPQDPKPQDPKPQDPKPQDPKPQDPKPQDPKPQDPKPQDPKPQDPKPQDPKPQDPKPQDPKPKKKSSALGIILGVGVAIVTFGAIAYSNRK